MKLPTIMSPDGRRAWAFTAIVGGAMVFSALIWVALYMVRDHPHFVFYLALAAHGQVFVGMTALGWVLGRRMQADVSKDGLKLDDQGGEP